MPDNDFSAICLLDDHPSVLKGLVRLLSSAGLEAEPFSDPHKFLAYERIHRLPVAVIVLDAAHEWARGAIAAPRHLTSTRVIMLTANDDPSLRAVALKAGASAFLTKPCDYEEFLETIWRALVTA